MVSCKEKNQTIISYLYLKGKLQNQLNTGTFKNIILAAPDHIIIIIVS